MDFDRADAARTLGASASFAALSQKDCARIVAESPVETVRAGTRLFSQGDPGSFAFMVLEGFLNVDVATEAGEVTVARIGAGQLVGEIGAFASTPRTASVLADTDATLLRIEQATVHKLMIDSPETAVAVLGELGARLQSLNETIAILTQAARALAADRFEPDMLDLLRRNADRFSTFADVFEEMAAEIRAKRQFGQEMAAAAQIQQALLPNGVTAPEALRDTFELAAAMTPARHVGGDFYDYFMLDDETMGLAIGDVSGKGVPAAIFMSLSRTILRTVARAGGTPAEVLEQVNAQLAEGNREMMFVTVAFARLDLRTGALACATGGHEEVFVIRKGGAVEALAPTGPALGLFEDAAFGEHAVQLAPGDSFVLATDGVTEAFNAGREAFGQERFNAALKAYAAGSAEGMVAGVSKAVASHVGNEPPSDDLTGLALRYLGASK